MLPIDWNTAIKYAKLVLLAESIPPAGDDNALKLAITNAGYTYLETIYGDELATDIDPHAGQIVSYGFLALSPTNELVASIRGTSTLLEWIHDASFLMVSSPIHGLSGFTEDGFTAIYKGLRTDKPGGRHHCCGRHQGSSHRGRRQDGDGLRTQSWWSVSDHAGRGRRGQYAVQDSGVLQLPRALALETICSLRHLTRPWSPTTASSIARIWCPSCLPSCLCLTNT